MDDSQFLVLEGKAEAPPSLNNLSVNIGSKQAVASFYYGTYVPALNPAIGWTGTLNPCNPGTTNQTYRDMTLQMINYFRAMAQLPAAIVFSTTNNPKCQEAALMMIRNGVLTHCTSSCSGLLCFTNDAATAAQNSNLAIGAHGPAAITGGYMADPGASNTPVGHRRWLLYPQQTTMATGDTDGVNGSFNGSNALWVLGPYGSIPPTPAWVSWPPPGFVPYQVVYPRWSFSRNRNTTDMGSANVSMTLNGNNVGLTVIHRSSDATTADNFGDDAVVWEPSGITTGAGMADLTYHVTISNVLPQGGGAPMTFEYDVTIFDPALVPTGTPTPTASPTRSPSPSPSPSPSVSPTPSPSPTPLQDAVNAGGSVPATLAAGYTHPVTLIMSNTGDTSWTNAAGYSLAVLADSCNLLSGGSRIGMPGTPTVEPTQSVTFAFDLKAPGSNQACTLQLQMIQEFVMFFGEIVTLTPQVVSPVKNAQFLSNTIPPTMAPGQGLHVGVTVRNLCNMPWRSNGRFTLSVVNDPCGLVQSDSAPFDDVFPNQTNQFFPRLEAPGLAQTCHLEFRMAEHTDVAAGKEHVLLSDPPVPFGPVLALDIEIAEPPNASRSWEFYE